MKKYIVTYLAGILTIILFGFIFYKKYPEFFIKKITETETVYKEIPGKDPEYCGEIKITGFFIEDKLNIKAEDDCKYGTAIFTIGIHETFYRHMLQFQFVNMFKANDFKNYGGNINYTYFVFRRIGLTAGITYVISEQVSLHGGISYLW